LQVMVKVHESVCKEKVKRSVRFETVKRPCPLDRNTDYCEHFSRQVSPYISSFNVRTLCCFGGPIEIGVYGGSEPSSILLSKSPWPLVIRATEKATIMARPTLSFRVLIFGSLLKTLRMSVGASFFQPSSSPLCLELCLLSQAVLDTFFTQIRAGAGDGQQCRHDQL